MRMPLEDVKVLDLSHALAGPFCSTMLGSVARTNGVGRGPGWGGAAGGRLT